MRRIEEQVKVVASPRNQPFPRLRPRHHHTPRHSGSTWVAGKVAVGLPVGRPPKQRFVLGHLVLAGCEVWALAGHAELRLRLP